MDSDCYDHTTSGSIIKYIKTMFGLVAILIGIFMIFMVIWFCIAYEESVLNKILLWIKLKVFRRTDRNDDANIIAVAA